MQALALVEEAYPEHPAMDVAVSHAVLAAVAEGSLGGVFRLHVPGPIVAFGRADRVQPGYSDAVRAATAHGFEAVERLAGGRAAVFHEQTLAFSLAMPVTDSRTGISERFSVVAGAMSAAFQKLGLDARVGEVPGEYCPGAWSVNIAGRFKVMGVGQRLVRGAAHVGGVVVVDGARRVRDVLIPVYRALRIDWDPRTTGALADRSPGLDTGKVAKAIIGEVGRVFDLQRRPLPTAVVDSARALIAEHLPRVA